MHIDWWTLALQAVNVLVLVWILSRFLYRPVALIIEQRRAAVAKALSDASAMRDAAAKEKAGLAATRAGFVSERDALLADARKQIQAERDATLRDASGRIEKLRSENTAVLDRERHVMEQALSEQASILAVQIAQKLLAQLPPDAAVAVFLDGLCRQIANLPARSRELLVASALSGSLNLTSAATLNEAQKEQCRRTIEAALGAKANISFQTDPGLIAGVKLSGGALMLRNDWQTDLTRILGQLKRDDG